MVLAFAIFSLSAVTTLLILNKGVAISQRSLEKSLVRQQVDSQSEMIRYLHDTNNPQWANIKSMAIANPLPLSGPCPDVSQLGSGGQKGFFVVPDALTSDKFQVLTAASPNYELPSRHASVDFTNKKSQGIWVQVVLAENNSGLGINAYDFYIHGCWDSVGQTVPMTVGTIVRVYDK
jgi:hypothetical protein